MEKDNQDIVDTFLYNTALHDLETLRPVIDDISHYHDMVTTKANVEDLRVELLHRIKIWESLGRSAFLFNKLTDSSSSRVQSYSFRREGFEDYLGTLGPRSGGP